jgi:Reverse transcriptase (RNA-dependent DNA polymerase)
MNKLSKNGKRLFIMGSPRDKIVQRAILRVLQQIYEGVSLLEYVENKVLKSFKDRDCFLYCADPKRIKMEKDLNTHNIKKWILHPVFSDNSFGFRPNRSPHSVFKLIKKTWSPVVWLWSAEFITAFENVNHNRLINEIEKKIDDPILINELRKMIKVKIINLKDISASPSVGTLQGNILTPFLFNIYVSPLDYYIDELKVKYNKQGMNLPNPEYCK